MTIERERVTELLFLAADEELDSNQATEIRRRIQDCEECAREADYVVRFLQVVRKRCVRYQAPTRLRLRILSSFDHRRGT